MGEEEAVVKTDVDRLIGLIQEKKEISISDAAKELGVSMATMESLTDLLEEEGIIHIKYKFTTPYILYGGQKGKMSMGMKPAEEEKETAAKPEENKILKIDMRDEFFFKARQRGLTDDKINVLWQKYIDQNMDYIKGKFFAMAKDKGLAQDKITLLWDNYLRKIRDGR